MISVNSTMFEQTWEVAVKLCKQGKISGRNFSVGVALHAQPENTNDKRPRWTILGGDGKPVFTAPPEEETDGAALFTIAKRFIELEDATQRGVTLPDYTPDPRRTYKDSLREWGLMDEAGRVIKAYDHDPEPLLGYVVRVGEVYAYGIVKQSALSEGTITPTGACDNPEEARRRASELLMLALVRGATVMGMNGVPAVIDLSADADDDNS